MGCAEREAKPDRLTEICLHLLAFDPEALLAEPLGSLEDNFIMGIEVKDATGPVE
jgi:hypothetical protein